LFVYVFVLEKFKWIA